MGCVVYFNQCKSMNEITPLNLEEESFFLHKALSDRTDFNHIRRVRLHRKKLEEAKWKDSAGVHKCLRHTTADTGGHTRTRSGSRHTTAATGGRTRTSSVGLPLTSSAGWLRTTSGLLFPTSGYDTVFTHDERKGLVCGARQYDTWVNLRGYRNQVGKMRGWHVVSHPAAIQAIRVNFIAAGSFYQQDGYWLKRKGKVTGMCNENDVYCLQRMDFDILIGKNRRKYTKKGK